MAPVAEAAEAATDGEGTGASSGSGGSSSCHIAAAVLLAILLLRLALNADRADSPWLSSSSTSVLSAALLEAAVADVAPGPVEVVVVVSGRVDMIGCVDKVC